jgi:hypothetical protein
LFAAFGYLERRSTKYRRALFDTVSENSAAEQDQYSRDNGADMRIGLGVFLAAVIGCLCLAARGTLCGDDRPVPVGESRLRHDLLECERKDQAVRQKLIAFAKGQGLGIDSKELPNRGKLIIEEMAEIDASNCRRLKEIIDKRGWPSRTLVGAEGAHAAFLLAQHANRDLPFQERCLRLMQMAQKGEVAGADLALITNRVAVANGRKQVYGTQVELRDGRWRVQGAVEDPNKLNDRRKEVGLASMEEYLRLVAMVYGTGGTARNH